jgi:hypothetical protein
LILLPCKSLKATREGRIKEEAYIPTNGHVFLWQGRSYIRKGLEAYFTVLIEIIWGKERIMEVYLNSIEMEMVCMERKLRQNTGIGKNFWSYTKTSCGIAFFAILENMRQQVLRTSRQAKAKSVVP